MEASYLIKKQKDFETVFKKGKSFRQGFLFLKIVKNEKNLSRFGLVVAKKTTKRAVIRNKIRRRLKEIVRVRLPQIKKGFDVVLVAQPPAANTNYKELEATLEKLFKKAKLLD